MKRISLGLMLLASMPAVGSAYGYGYCGGVRYSPYAFSYRHSGLVPAGVDYTPYALTYHQSGLVQGYGTCSGSYTSYVGPVTSGRISRSSYHGSHSARHYAQDTSQTPQSPDGVTVIRQYLLARGIESVNINRIFRIDNQLVSVDILVKDRNLLIKYWNPDGIAAMDAKEAFKQKAYAKYQEDWGRLAAAYEQNGGQVYYVEASDATTIVAALNSCPMLGGSPDASDRTVMYAKE